MEINFDKEDQDYIGKSPTETRTIYILFNRMKVINSIQKYYMIKRQGSQAPSNTLTSSVMALFLDVSSSLKRSIKKEEYEQIRSLCFSDSPVKCLEGFILLDNWLDAKGLTKFDTKKNIDYSKIEEVNIFKDPKTDVDKLKKSQTGIVVVTENDSVITLKDGLNREKANMYKDIDLLEDVFVDVKLVRDDSLAEIRARVLK